jgi:Permuted papain-like amidase enzyme, YaeF/YiiX, C92 family
MGRLRNPLVVASFLLCLSCQAGIRAGPGETIGLARQDLASESQATLADKITQDPGVVRAVIQGLTDLEQRAQDAAAEIGPSSPRSYTQAENDRIRALLLSYLNYRSVLLRLLGYYSAYETIPREDLRLKSFLLAYVSGLTLYREGIILVTMFRGRPRARAKLNEAEPIWGIPPDIFDTVYRNITNPANVRLLGEAWNYYTLQIPRLAHNGLTEGAEFGWLNDTIRRQQRFIEDNAVDIWEGQGDILRASLQGVSHGATYNVLTLMGLFVSNVKIQIARPLVTAAQVQELKGVLHPGDLILERRNWFLSNGFLPGFWPHMALYVGSAEDLRRLGLTTHPLVRQHLEEYQQPDRNGRERRVIEAGASGVIFNSLEESLAADYVAVLRPRVSEARKNAAIARAFSHYGKPYDFDFDFSTTDKLVCTELIYRAYDEPIRGESIQFRLVQVLGRYTLPPQEVVDMFAQEHALDMKRQAIGLPPVRQLDFVLFLDADPGSGEARRAGVEEFIRSARRPAE